MNYFQFGLSAMNLAAGVVYWQHGQHKLAAIMICYAVSCIFYAYL